MLLIFCRLIVYIVIFLLSNIFGYLLFMENIQRKFGERIRNLRLRKKLSQEKLAFESKMHRTYIGGIERGERNPSLKNIEAIANALGITLSDLFRFENCG